MQKLLFLLFIISLTGCGVSKFNAAKKYSPQELLQDYNAMRSTLESRHPSLYWYTSKDSMDGWFNYYGAGIKDSMTELQFAWQVLAPMLEKVQCGHTSLLMSKGFTKASKNVKLPSFPLYIKVWNDSMAVIGSLIKNDSTFKRGTLIKAINGYPNAYLISRMFNYLPHDAEALNINYIRLSSNFPYYHRNIFGLSQQYTIDYIDSLQETKRTVVDMYKPPVDTTQKDSTKKKAPKVKKQKIPRSERLKAFRNISYDSTGTYAYMELRTFNKQLIRGFLRRSFRDLHDKKTPNLVLDLRNNGGGRVGISKQLTRYLTREPYRIADTISAKTRKVSGIKGARVEYGFLNNIWMFIASRKGKDGRYHIRNMERHVIKPKKQNHYDGKVFVITGGPTFSASTLFCNVVKGQPGITLVGEETGGGWYGNNGIIIPDVTLGNTGIRFRLPMYRVVQYDHVPKSVKTGIVPDILIPVSYDAVINRYDNKMVEIKKMIFSGSSHAEKLENAGK